MILIVLSVFWVAGIWLGSFCHLPVYLIFFSILPLPFLLIKRLSRKAIILCSLGILAFCGGGLRYDVSGAPDSGDKLQLQTGARVTIRGMIDRDPEVRDTGVQVQLQVSEIKTEAGWIPEQGKVLLFASRNDEYKYGDILQATGKLETPPQFDDFNYRGYLANRGIFSVMYYPGIETIDHDRGNPIISGIYTVRNRLAESLAKILPEPQASLAQGILLGIRGNIPQELKDEFTHSGTSHLLAISGQNLSIVAGILVSIGLWIFGRRHYIYVWLALCVVLFYTLLTGLDAPVVRSAIMTGIFLFAELFGRQKSAGVALSFTAAVMIGISPLTLWEVSFQLSFLAMAGLVLIATPLQEVSHKRVANMFGDTGARTSLVNTVWDSIWVTLGALLMVWPLIVYYFNIFSLAAPVSTLLAAPAMTGIILLSVIAGGLGILWLPLGYIAGWIAWLFLSYMLLIVRGFAAIPHTFITVSEISPATVIGYYIVLGSILFTLSHRRQIPAIFQKCAVTAGRICGSLNKANKKWVIIPLGVTAVLVVALNISLPDDKLHVSFLDVGQGDAILIQKGNMEILVDGGPSPQAITMALGRQMPFWDRTIEMVISTHPDEDHLTGMTEVLKRYKVEQVLCPDFSADTDLYRHWTDLLSAERAELTIAEAGQQIVIGGDEILEVLSPQVPPQFEDGSDDNGIVLRLSDGQISFLLTADISAAGEFTLISERAVTASTVLKVAHHGSGGSTTDEFLNTVDPQIAVISVGEDNRYGHPATDVVQKLNDKIGEAAVYRTDEDGTVEFTTDGSRLWVQTER